MQYDQNRTELLPPQAVLGALRVRVFASPDDVMAAWQWLEQDGIFTYFQTRTWCLTWLKDIGQLNAVRGIFVLAEDDTGKPAFLLPLQIRRKRGFSMLEFLTVPHGSYGFGLYSQAFLDLGGALWFETHFSALLALLPPHDVVYLRDMPTVMLGHKNPMSTLGRLTGANNAFMLRLSPDFEALLASKRSVETIRNIRKRDKRLQTAGTLTFGTPLATAEREAAVKDMFADQEVRLAQTGIHNVYETPDRKFLSGLTDSERHGTWALDPYRLAVNGKTICVLLGGRACNTFWAMIISMAPGDWRKHSPGDFTLRHVIEAQCNAGIEWFDLALGHSSYKLPWADSVIETRVLVQGRSLKGLLLSVYLVAKLAFKRVLKGSPTLRTLVFGLRRLLFGKSI